MPTRDAAGELSKTSSPRFSVELTADNAPWAYYRVLPYRTMAALEALATLMAVIAFAEFMPRKADARIIMRSVADNLGKERALTRLSSTKFPFSIISMELAAQMDQRWLRLEMQWAPREFNQEADVLSSGSWKGFDPSKRAVKDFGSIRWLVLNDLVHFGLEFHAGRHGPS